VLHNIMKCLMCLYGFSITIPSNGVAATISMILDLISYLVASSFESDSCTFMSSHRGLA
jgi:hypothetical protein